MKSHCPYRMAIILESIKVFFEACNKGPNPFSVALAKLIAVIGNVSVWAKFRQLKLHLLIQSPHIS